MMTAGRNDPCPCGAKKPDGNSIKYKKCCWLKRERVPTEEGIRQAMEAFGRHQAERASWREKGIFINYVNPLVYENPKTGGKSRAWALANTLLHSRPEHETFHAFILDYLLKHVLGKEWWEEQEKAAEKHFIFSCYQKLDEWADSNRTEANKVDEHTWGAQMNGWVKTLLSLAFDAATLSHTKHLPEHTLERLKHPIEYQGAHYEIAVAAIFSRLGCSIEFLDDKTKSTTHCEFIATHNETGAKIAVEAKSRRRPGVRHWPGTAEPEKQLRGDMRNLLEKALTQNPKNMPYVIFIDVNAPLTPGTPVPEKPWFKDIFGLMEKYPAPTQERPEEFAGLFFTNFSPHYNEARGADPNEYFTVIPKYAARPMPGNPFASMLQAAVQHYGFVPNITEKSK